MASPKTAIFTLGAFVLTNAPAPFNGWSMRCNDTNGISELNTEKAYSTLNAYLAKAIAERVKGTASAITLVECGADAYAAEGTLPDGRPIVARLKKDGTLEASIIEPTGRYSELPGFGTNSTSFDSSVIEMLLLERAIRLSPQAQAALDETQRVYDATGEFEQYPVYRLCDAVYYAVKTDAVKCHVPQGSVEKLSKNAVELGTCNGVVICGMPTLLAGAGSAVPGVGKPKKMTFGLVRKEFEALGAQNQWTDEEKALIPNIPDDFPVAAEAYKIARRYMATRGDVRPMCNFMWRGITSYGKSTGVEVISALLNRPLLRVTCNSTMETQDLLSCFVPDNGTAARATEELPSFDQMAYDPASAYMALTGVEDDAATSEMCLEAYGKAVAARNCGEARFRHIESNYVIALKKGYIVEIQEMSRCKDPGVFVGLNEYDKPGARIPLVDGSFARRHPDAICIYTDNVGYASCHAIDPSVIRRMDFILDSYEMSKEAVLERVRYNTGFADDALLDLMYDIWAKVADFCRDKEINEGSISVTELERWVQSLSVEGPAALRETCMECLVAKATSDIEEQNEIESSVIAIAVA